MRVECHATPTPTHRPSFLGCQMPALGLDQEGASFHRLGRGKAPSESSRDVIIRKPFHDCFYCRKGTHVMAHAPPPPPPSPAPPPQVSPPPAGGRQRGRRACAAPACDRLPPLPWHSPCPPSYPNTHFLPLHSTQEAPRKPWPPPQHPPGHAKSSLFFWATAVWASPASSSASWHSRFARSVRVPLEPRS